MGDKSRIREERRLVSKRSSVRGCVERCRIFAAALDAAIQDIDYRAGEALLSLRPRSCACCHASGTDFEPHATGAGERLPAHMVEGSCGVPSVSAVVQGLERGWDRRSAGHYIEAGLLATAWRERDLA